MATSGKLAAVVLVPAAMAVASGMLYLRMRVQPPTIPPYAVAAGAPTELHPGGDLSLTLDPQGLLTGAVGAHAFLVRGDDVRPWEPQIVVDREGVIHVSGSVDRMFTGVPPGDWDLALVVGRPETLPRSPQDALRPRGSDAGTAAWWLVRQHVRLAGS